MKTKIPLSILVFACILLGCNKEDDGPTNNTDVSAQVDEYPNSGNLIATASSNLKGDLTYSMTTVSVSDAFLLDAVSGELRVANPLAYDYETHTEITGQITVTNGTESEVLSVQVDINDIDDIAFILTDSKAAYQLANPGDWVPITSNEYLSLSVQLTEVTKSGITDQLYEKGISVQVFDSYFDATVANNLAPIPTESFVFAFMYYSERTTDGNKVKVSSTSVTEGFEDLGNPLPGQESGQRFFVLKGSEAPTTASGYLGIYSKEGVSYDVRGHAEGSHYFADGDTNTIGNNFNVVQTVCLYQGLSTPIKQWD